MGRLANWPQSGMDLTLNEEHKMLGNMVRDFVNKEIAPIVSEIDRGDKLPDWAWTRLGQLGLLGVITPPEFGGEGLDYVAATICQWELSRVCPALGLSWMAHVDLCGHNIYRNGTDEQRQQYLPPMCRGDKVGAMALTEPNAGSDAVSIQTVARRVGDHYALNGQKMFITNGMNADVFIVYTKTAPERRHRGITAFIVERGFDGVFTSNPIDKIGVRGSGTAELVFENYMVPVENVLGQENNGIDVMMSGLDTERTLFAAWSVGLIDRALELSLRYSKERVQFGKPIGEFQLIQTKLCDMYVSLEAARLLTFKAALLASAAERGGKGTEIHKVAAGALLFAAEAAAKAASEAVQVHGGYGYTNEFPVSQLYRDAKLAEIGAGTSEVRRLIIARELLAGA